MREFKDVQKENPLYSIPIERAGVKNVKMPIVILRNGEENHLIATFSVFVDLPSQRKGADMSRAVEAINEVVFRGRSLFSIEELAIEVAKECLKRFEYSNAATVSLNTELYSKRKTESGKESYVAYPLSTEAELRRDGKMLRSIEVEVLGINACPCAMETSRTIISNEKPELEFLLEEIPGITHNQRNHVKIKVTMDTEEVIEAIRLVEIAEGVLGGPILPILKRIDEGKLVIRAHRNPLFVEDIARAVTDSLLSLDDLIPDSAFLYVSSESEESIHPHNAYALVNGRAGDLRKGRKAAK
ncbi:GTP cyclohydrolase MptA [Cuniculiplasma sp. SKW3]|uniref:GTP cyclohydrolase MptA n=1 Tax=unclassified Cuniculiplasma TaxID=2619706 RepID=UPI003FD2FCC7